MQDLELPVLSKERGFTLIELLVACAIIGVLAALLFTVLNPIEQYKKAHDAQRKHDLEQIRTALDLYYDDNGHYPPSQTEFNSNLPTYLSAKLLTDPLGRSYCYQSDNGNSYIISTNLERNSDPQIIIPNPVCNSNSYNYAIVSTNASLFAFAATPTLIPTNTPTFTPTPTPITAFDSGAGDFAYYTQQTSDGGYIIAGYSQPLDYNMFLVKLDSFRDFSWGKKIGTGSTVGFYDAAQQTSDGGYIIGGWTSAYGAFTDSGAFASLLVKLNSSGNLSWAKTTSGVRYNRIHSVQQTSDGGYIAGGETNSFTDQPATNKLLLLRYTNSGELSWAKTIGGGGLYSIRTGIVRQTADGGYIMAGTAYLMTGTADLLLIKLDSFGNQIWIKKIGGADFEYARFVKQTSDGGYIAGGETHSFGAGAYDIFLVKLDSSGNLSWAKTIGDGGSNYPTSFEPTSDDGYIMSGYTSGTENAAGNYDGVLLVKLDKFFNLSWTKKIEGLKQTSYPAGYPGYAGFSVGSDAKQTSDGGYIVTGHSTTFKIGGYPDALVIKTDSNGNINSCNRDSRSLPFTVASQSPTINSPSLEITSRIPVIYIPGSTEITTELFVTTSEPSLSVTSWSPTLISACYSD